MLPDFVLLPPEVNSTRIYAGPRSGSMWAAAAAWDSLAAALGSAASSFQSTVSGLTGGAWQGPTSMSMEVAATPVRAMVERDVCPGRAGGQPSPVIGGSVRGGVHRDGAPGGSRGQSCPADDADRDQHLGAEHRGDRGDRGRVLGDVGPGCDGDDGLRRQYQRGRGHVDTVRQAAHHVGRAELRRYRPSPQPVRTCRRSPSSLTQTLSTSMSRLQMLSTPAQFAMEPMNMVMGQLMGGNTAMGAADSSVPTMGPSLMSDVSPGGLGSATLSGRLVSASVGQGGSVGRLSVPASWADAAPATTPAPVAPAVPSTAVSPIVGQLAQHAAAAQDGHARACSGRRPSGARHAPRGRGSPRGVRLVGRDANVLRDHRPRPDGCGGR